MTLRGLSKVRSNKAVVTAPIGVGRSDDARGASTERETPDLFDGAPPKKPPQAKTQEDQAPQTGVRQSTLDVRAPNPPTNLQALLTTLLPPRADQTVLELGSRWPSGAVVTGAGGPASDHARAGAQVTAFVDDATAEKERASQDAFHHVEQRGAQPLATLGLKGRFDLVLAQSADLRDSADAAALVEAVAPGGALVFLRQGRSPDKTLLQAAEAAGLTIARRQRLGGGADGAWALVLKRPGERRTDDMLDRITCVERDRVADLMAAPLFKGPAAIAAVPDDDTQLRAQLDAMLAHVRSGVAAGHVDLQTLPLPDRVAQSAATQAPGIDALVVFAHPDDESGYAAGALANNAAQGKSMHLVVATDGAGGVGYQLEDGVSLAEVRARELTDALEALGVAGHSVLGLPDAGMYLDEHRSAPVTAASTLSLWGLEHTLKGLVEQIRKHRPRAVLGFHPERDPGYSLHGHHLAMGLATTLAVHLAADPLAFPELGLPPFSVDEQWAVIPPGAKGGTQIEVAVDAGKKIAALKAHRSQLLSVARLVDRLVEAPKEVEHWHRLQGRDGAR